MTSNSDIPLSSLALALTPPHNRLRSLDRPSRRVKPLHPRSILLPGRNPAFNPACENRTLCRRRRYRARSILVVLDIIG